MKKYLKSAAAVLLGSTFAFSAVACDSGNSGDKKPQASDYYESLFTTYENMKGLKVKAKTKNSQAYTSKPEDNASVETSAEALFAFTKNGVRAHVTEAYTEDDEDYEAEAYYIDGICYEKEQGEDATDFYWSVSYDDDIIDMDVELPAILGEFTPADIQKMLADYKDDIVDELKKGKAEGDSYKVSFTYDAKDDLNALLGIFDPITLKTEIATGEYAYTTIAEAIDAILKAQNVKIGTEYLTTAKILKTIAGWGDVTVGTAVSALETAIGMTLDQLKEKILSSSVVTAIDAKMQELAKKPEYAKTAGAIVEAIAAAKSFNIADTLALVKEMTLDQLLAVVWPMIQDAIGGENGEASVLEELVPDEDGGSQDSAGDESAPTLLYLAGMLDEITRTSIVDFVRMTGIFPSEAILQELLDMIQATTFTAANVEVELAFSLKTGTLTNAAFGVVNTFEVAMGEAGKEITSSEVEYDFEFLYDAPAIEVPEGEKFVDLSAYWTIEGGVPDDRKEDVQATVSSWYYTGSEWVFDFEVSSLQSGENVLIRVEFAEPTSIAFTSLTGKIVMINRVYFEQTPEAKEDCLAKYGLSENVTIGVTYDKEAEALNFDVASLIPAFKTEK